MRYRGKDGTTATTDHDGRDVDSDRRVVVIPRVVVDSLSEPQTDIEPERRRAGVRIPAGGGPEVRGEPPGHAFGGRFGEGVERHQAGCRTGSRPRLHTVADLANIAAAAIVEDGAAASTQLELIEDVQHLHVEERFGAAGKLVFVVG